MLITWIDLLVPSNKVSFLHIEIVETLKMLMNYKTKGEYLVVDGLGATNI